jgi:hypothetical protein
MNEKEFAEARAALDEAMSAGALGTAIKKLELAMDGLIIGLATGAENLPRPSDIIEGIINTAKALEILRGMK